MRRVSWSSSTGQGSQELRRTARAVNSQAGGYGPGMGKEKASGLFASCLTRREPKGHGEGIRELEGTCSSLTEGVRLGKDKVEKLRGERQRERPRSWGHWWEKGTGGDSAAWPCWHGSGEAAGGVGWGCWGHLCGGAFKPAKPLRPQSALMKCFDKI